MHLGKKYVKYVCENYLLFIYYYYLLILNIINYNMNKKTKTFTVFMFLLYFKINKFKENLIIFV